MKSERLVVCYKNLSKKRSISEYVFVLDKRKGSLFGDVLIVE